MEEQVTISKKEYEELLEDSQFLAFLRSHGVDNWDWYGDACADFYGDDEED